MGKVIYSMMVSLDGFVEDVNRGLGWVIIDEELHRFANDEARETGTFLYGRRLYELMSDYWPAADSDLSIPEYVAEFARIWREKPKIVFSRTLEKVEWNSRLVRENCVEEIMRLKEESGKDMSVGGPSLASTFMQRGLIDEYRLLVHPVVLGAGTPFFSTLERAIPLRLVETRPFRSGVVYLRYQSADHGRG
jgi:dihydrofolate reductase